MTHVETLMWIREATDRDLATIALRLLASDPREFETLVQEHKRLLALKDKARIDKQAELDRPLSFYVPYLGHEIEITTRELEAIAALYTCRADWIAAIKYAKSNIFPHADNPLRVAKWACEFFRDNGMIPEHRSEDEQERARQYRASI